MRTTEQKTMWASSSSQNLPLLEARAGSEKRQGAARTVLMVGAQFRGKSAVNCLAVGSLEESYF